MTKKYFFSPRVLLPTYIYIEFQSKQNRKRDFEFFTTPYCKSMTQDGSCANFGKLAKYFFNIQLADHSFITVIVLLCCFCL